jgi:cobalamin biosynthesis protein CobD/CbiB
MGPSIMVVLALLTGIVLVPLAREYRDLRRSFGLTRVGAFATTLLVVPAFGVAVVLALPFEAHPVAQWLTTVVTTLVAYSLATRAIAASASSAEPAPSRITRG